MTWSGAAVGVDVEGQACVARGDEIGMEGSLQIKKCEWEGRGWNTEVGVEERRRKPSSS
jgi:hypothetical protein